MKNLLVLNFFPAFTPPSSGGEVRIFHFYCELSKYFNVTLLSSAEVDGERAEVWHTNNFVEIRAPKDNSFVTQWQLLSPHAGVGDLSGPSVAATGLYFNNLHKEYLAAYPKADVIVHEFPFTLYYDVFRGLDIKPRIYNSHNCEYKLYEKLHATSDSNVISDLVRSVEKELLLSADLVTYCGEDDLKSFEAMTGRSLGNVLFNPNGMTMKAMPNIKGDRKLKKTVFIGSGHLPNVQAAEYIVQHIAPKCPEFIFDIIGDCLPPGEYPSNVVRHGRVDDDTKSNLISNADIAINPMLSGSGSSLKILDFVAHCVPVLSTPIGMRGFEFKKDIHCVLIDLKDFASKLKTYSSKSAQLSTIANSAYKFALNRYTWSSIANRFNQSVEKLLQSHGTSGKTAQHILALNDYDPFSAIGGGATRLQGLYSASAEWSRVVVLCFSDSNKIEVTKESNNIYCVRIPKALAHIEEEHYFNSRFHVSTNDIVALRHIDRNQIFKDIYAVLRTQARVVVCDHPYLSPLPIAYSDRFVYSSQNCEYGLKKDLLEWHPDKDALLDDVRLAERRCVASAAAIVVVSAKDGIDLVSGVKAAAPVTVVANGASLPAIPSPEDLSAAKRHIFSKSAVFMGSAHMPNVDAAKFIVESLSTQCSDVDFHIVGSVCQALPKELPSNVKAWGLLNESMKAAVLSQCSVAINPMFSGSGSNVKLADFLANGLYVVSTEFGVRGYPDDIFNHVSVSDRASFPTALVKAIGNPATSAAENRRVRHQLFLEQLSMHGLGADFVKLLKGVETRKKRMLFVTYRYTYPYLGGAESYLARLISSAGNSGEFAIDVIAPEVTAIRENYRFSSHYEFDSNTSAPPEMQNVRFARFPLALQKNNHLNEGLHNAWRAQSEFEKQLYLSSGSNFSKSGLTWGWAHPNDTIKGNGRWCFSESGIHISDTSRIQISGYVRQPLVLRVVDMLGNELLHKKLESNFDIDFAASKGYVELYCSYKSSINPDDPRPLAIYVKTLSINGVPIDLDGEPLVPTSEDNALNTYLKFESAARASRGRSGISLTDLRGPHSPSLESFIEKSVSNYDIVVTHNNVFRPAIAATNAAKAAGVPSVLFPHAHLDDDFYHFTDVHQAALDADLVLASPKAACTFYEKIGVKSVKYHSPGVDAQEKFTDEDAAEFATIYNLKKPFFLVLGRKAGAKGYATVVSEIEKIAAKTGVHLVMIGPDDDGVVINSNSTTYLGQQPRSVVRGALKTCIALVNMSSSESFGMVLLEAWLAGRPVIVNAGCSAFLDLAVHKKNALIVTRSSLGEALSQLAKDKELGDRLGSAGKETAKSYEWEKVCKDFLDNCKLLIDQPQVKK